MTQIIKSLFTWKRGQICATSFITVKNIKKNCWLYLSGTVGLKSSEHWLRSFKEQFSNFDSAQVFITFICCYLNDVIQTFGETTIHLRQFFHVKEDWGELRNKNKLMTSLKLVVKTVHYSEKVNVFFNLPSYLSCDPPFGYYISDCLLLVWGDCSLGHLNLVLRTMAGYQLYVVRLGCVDAWYDIVSDTCHQASCCLKSKKLFPIWDDQYCNSEQEFKPGTEVSVSTWIWNMVT